METATKNKKVTAIKELEIKAALFDQLVELIEDSYLGQLMSQTEKEQSIPLSRAKKQLAK